MIPEPAPGHADAAQAFRAALRHGLVTALKARDTDALAALRTTIAAIDNAEAVPVPVPDTSRPATSVHIAGSRSGPGSAEAARRQLSASELRDILRAQITEHTREADRYDALGRADAAERLRRQARTLTAYLR